MLIELETIMIYCWIKPVALPYYYMQSNNGVIEVYQQMRYGFDNRIFWTSDASEANKALERFRNGTSN
jgi:hypothetical protein